MSTAVLFVCKKMPVNVSKIFFIKNFKILKIVCENLIYLKNNSQIRSNLDKSKNPFLFKLKVWTSNITKRIKMSQIKH